MLTDTTPDWSGSYPTRDRPMTQASPPARRIDAPRAGFFLVRLVKGGPRTPCRITQQFGLFEVEVNGKIVGAAVSDPMVHWTLMKVWEWGEEIDRAAYDRWIADPHKPDPWRPFDISRERSVF